MRLQMQGRKLLILLVAAVVVSVVNLSRAEADSNEMPDTASQWIDTEPLAEYEKRQFFAKIVLDNGEIARLGEELVLAPNSSEVKSRHLVVVRLAADGTERWRQKLVAEQPYGPSRMIADPDGALFVCDGSNNYYRLDDFGTIVWHVHYDYWLQSTCFAMAYHPAGMLLVAGERPRGRSPDGVVQFEAALAAYDADDGTIQWQTGYRPLDGMSGYLEGLTLGLLTSELRLVTDGIVWSGKGRIWDGINPQYFSWSFIVSTAGRIDTPP